MEKKRPYLGYAVDNRRIRFASVKQVKLFDAADDGCPRKWAFQYRFGKKLARTTVVKEGSEGAANLEHYLKTGEDVLPPVLQIVKSLFPAPGPDLECEEPLGDIETAIKMREAALRGAPVDVNELRRVAGLVAGEIPIDGAADYRHARQEYIGPDGEMHREAPGTRVIEIGDLKMVGRIFPHTITNGPNTGTVLPTFCKTNAEVCEDTQMIGYGRHAVERHPEITHVRLSHVYANKKKREAVKRTGIIPVETVIRRWERVEGVVRQMEQVALVERIEDVEPNLRACDSFVHVDPSDPEGKKMLKGCGYKYICPLSVEQTVGHMLGRTKETSMSLFDDVTIATPQAPQVPVAPPLNDAAYAAAVEEEKRKYLGLSAPPPAPPVQQEAAYGFCSKCGTPLNGTNASRLPSGEVKHFGCAAAMTAPLPPAPPPPQVPTAVAPPDQPRTTDPLRTAAAVPQREIERIEDPEIRADVEAHARAHAEKAAAEAAAAEQAKIAAGASAWCPTSAQKIAITAEIAMARKWICQCGKSYSVKTLNPIKEGDTMVSVIPRHKLPKVGEGAQTIAPSPVPKPQQLRIRTEIEPEAAPPAAPPPPVATPAPPVVAAPPPVAVAPPPPVVIPSNGANGYTHEVARTIEGLGVSLFRVTTLSGRPMSVIARGMGEALALANAKTESGVKSIELLPGEIVDGRAS